MCVMGRVASSTTGLQSSSVIQFSGDRSVIAITSQTSVARALLLSSFTGPVERRVEGGECERGVDIRFSFLGVYVGEFSIM
jgi:hypothetical protein